MFGSGPEQDRDCFTVVIIDDSLEEGVEEISLELSNSDGFLVTPLTISIVILDDEGTVEFICVYICFPQTFALPITILPGNCAYMVTGDY